MDNMNNVTPEGNGKMREHYTRIWVWFGWVGFIVAMCAGNREEEMTKTYLNHSLGMNIIGSAIGLLSIVFMIPYIGWLLAIICFIPIWAFGIYSVVVMIMGIVKACNDQPVNFFLFNLFHIIK